MGVSSHTNPARFNTTVASPRPAGAQKLSGHDRYRTGKGRYRILYSISDRELIVHVIRIADRKDVYRSIQ
jgi:mRNA interferase RelE/StbE